MSSVFNIDFFRHTDKIVFVIKNAMGEPMKKLLKPMYYIFVLIFFIQSVTVMAVNSASVPSYSIAPQSERVVFIKDVPRDDNYKIKGSLSGNGSGNDPQNPLIPKENELYNPTDAYPKNYALTAFYQATELLKDTGGTIVIMDVVYFGENEAFGSDINNRSVDTAEFGNRVIKITSVYNGVDYRKDGAKIVIASPANINMSGSVVFENVDIVTAGKDRAISFGGYPSLIGDGVTCRPMNPENSDKKDCYLSLIGGGRNQDSNGQSPSLTVKSGTYNKLVGGMWSDYKSSYMKNANINLTIEGSTKVLGEVIGTSIGQTDFSGNVNITVNGGIFECDLVGVGQSGMLNSDGILKFVINGGNFKKAGSISDFAVGARNNPPAVSTVDFGGWMGNVVGLAYAYRSVGTIWNIKLPSNITPIMLRTLLETQTVESATEPDITYHHQESSGGSETIKETINTQKPIFTTDRVEETVFEEEDESNETITGIVIGVCGCISLFSVVVIFAMMFVKRK